jgi:hypothetical protein
MRRLRRKRRATPPWIARLGCTLRATLMFTLSVCHVTHGQSIALEQTSLTEETTITFRVGAHQNPAIVPSCGDDSRDSYSLCTGPARLEVLRGRVWVMARPVCGCVLGAIPPDHEAIGPLPTASNTYLSFTFSKTLFGLHPGRLLRVAVDTWPDEDAFRSGKKPTTIWSQPFRCP